MKIKIVNLNENYKIIKSNLKKSFDELFKKQSFILGKEVETLEQNLSKFLKVKYSLGVSSGTSFREFAEKAWKLPNNCYDNHYPCMIHGVGLCDEWPFIAYPDKDFSNADYSGYFEEDMTICVETYIGEVGGKEGIKLEDQFQVTEKGLKQLSKFPLEQIN